MVGILRKAWQILPEPWGLFAENKRVTRCSKHPDYPLNPAWAAAGSAGEESPKQAAIHGHEERAPGFSVKRAGTKSCSGSDPAELYFGLLDGRRLSSGRLEKWGFLAGA